MRRRSAIAALAGSLAGLAGCLGSPVTAPDAEDLPKVTDYEVVQYRQAYPMIEEPPGEVRIYASEAGVRGRVDPEEAADPDAIRALLDGTEFDADRLVYVASESEDPTHREIRVGNVGVDAGQTAQAGTDVDSSAASVVGGAAIRQAVDETDEEGPTGAAALVRVRFDGDPPDQAVFNVEDGRRRQEAIGAVVETD